MGVGTATVRRRSARPSVTVTVEVQAADKPDVRYVPPAAGDIEGMDGDLIQPAALDAASVSGALYAMNRCRLRNVSITVRPVHGMLGTWDGDGPAIAASVAFYRAVGAEDRLDLSTLEDWELVAER